MGDLSGYEFDAVLFGRCLLIFHRMDEKRKFQNDLIRVPMCLA